MSNQGDDYQPGDLFWAKVGSHPWWPCMIYYTPDGEPYIKESGRKKSYHVQFLGPLVERAWLSMNNMIPFTGKKNFDEYVQEKLSTCKDKAEKAKFDSKSVSCSRKIWVQSWKEAESALNLSSKDRIEKFGRITVKSKAALIDKTEEAELLKLMSSVPLTIEEESESLSNFLKEEMTARLENNPEIDATILETELRTQWPAFDISTKRRYLRNQLGIFEKISQTSNSEKTSRKSKEAAAAKMHELVARPSETNRTPSSKSKKSVDSRSKLQEHREFDVEIHRLIVSPAQFRLQPVCPVCEVYSNAPGLMFKCRGPCGRIMHPRCMRYKNPPPADNSRPEKFRCPQCLTGEFLCAICNKPAETGSKSGIGPLFPCQVINCGRHFHRDCILGWPGILTRPASVAESASKSINFQLFRCPAHNCNTCHLELAESDPNEANKRCFNEGALLQCVRCPAAFHTGDLCTPAGSVEVSLSHIVCPRHFDSSLNSLPAFKTQHPSSCFHCLKSTPERLECETCPMTYHKECLQPSDGSMVDGKFICRSCQVGMFPRYAQIVWAKINHFRWWPCEIIHARNAPINILNMSHPEGSFPVHFLGSDEYQWISRSRVFPYEIGLNKPVARDSHGSSKVEKAFTCSLAHAPRAHALYVNHVLRRGLPLFTMHAEPLPEEELLPQSAMDSNISTDPVSDETQLSTILSTFTFIDKNDDPDGLLDKFQSQNATTDATTPTTTITTEVCSCFNTKKPCCASTKCPQALAKIECEPKLCSYGDADCGNRKFTLHKVSNHPTTSSDCTVAVIRTINRGYGLKSLINLEKNDLILEYIGEVIDIDEANKRITEALGGSAALQSRKIVQPLTDTYLARLGSSNNLVLDAGSRGNLARFINHACEPNVTVECWIVNGIPRLGLFAKQNVNANEELTIDYLNSGFLSTGLMGTQSLCLCGADLCISTLRLPTAYEPIPTPSDAVESQPERRRSSRKIEDIPTVTEDSSIQPDPTTTTNSKPQTPAPKAVPEKAPISVTSLLAAAASQTRFRRDRALISPSTAATRASMSSKQKQTTEKSNSEVTDNKRVLLRSPIHEDFCYRCGDGGELVLCDKTACPKSFHLNCLGLANPPAGIWYCPWHYCDLCGHPSSHLCWRCPNSYCDQHADEKLIQIDELDTERWQLARSGLNEITSSAIISSVRWICADHTGLKIYGPGYRPRLTETELGTPLESNHVVQSVKALDSEGNKINNDDNKNNDEERENIIPKPQELENVSSEKASTMNGKSEVRRLEPLKVTLKRKLRAEMAEQQSVENSALLDQTKTPTDSHRKRTSLTGSVSEKKRPRLLKEFAAK